MILRRVRTPRTRFRIAGDEAVTIVVEGAFTEWTRDGNLRDPAFLVREDEDPRQVRRDPTSG
jgi:hypothetical protein